MQGLVTTALALASYTLAAPTSSNGIDRTIFERDGAQVNVFEDAAIGGRMEFVNNSGICETTPGVNQYSGYFSIGPNMNMWFWFFESRNSPATAPLAAWFNGGPGCSSMIGLFQENGPCHFLNGESEPSLNEYSFNEFANSKHDSVSSVVDPPNKSTVIYIDQPISVGFSYGDDNVTSTATAAPEVYSLLQMFYKAFPQYESRDFGILTESYGGHYGPEFAEYIQEQNTAITAGTSTAQPINLVALGVNNGWFDAGLQEQAYIDYALNNEYKQILTPQSAQRIQSTLTNQCLPAIAQCASSGSNSACQTADRTCGNGVENAIINAADFDVYDVRLGSDAVDPPETYVDYLGHSDVKSAIGAQSTYVECANPAGSKFSSTGDSPRSLLPELGSVVQSGIQVILWSGDADWICNWIGDQYIADNVTFGGQSAFRAASLQPYNVNGAQGGTFKTQDNFSFLRVFGAGHEVPYYAPELSLQVFRQIMSGQPLSST
ncbi:MAG: hypothetical protein Q9162_002989, partial [Coniocarpon cinnabarinum]